MKTIVITGGHHNSALVVAKAFIKKGYKVVWLGHRYASRGDLHDSPEYLEVKVAGIIFHELKAGKLDSTPTVSEIANIPLGFIRAYKLLKDLKPIAVLSFGGYLGLAVSLPANWLGIPVYLHEQTLFAGKANVVTGRFARRIYLAWDQASKFFPRSKTKLVGLPIRDSIVSSIASKLFPNNQPIILVLGGKQGSHVINTNIFKALPQLLKNYNVVHQTGTSSVTGDFLAALVKKDKLTPKLASNYLPVGYIGEGEIGTYFASASLVVGRSGAHTAYEIGLLGKRAVLIPFIHTTGGEQREQARLLENAGLALVLPESGLTVESLIKTITKALAPHSIKSLSLPRDATESLIKDMLADLK